MDFEQTIQEAYRGFGQSAHLDVSELRLLYYGRPDVFISFTDDGDVDIHHDELPECFISYDVRDVVGKRVRSSDFYAYVYRIDKNRGRWMHDVRRYKKDDFFNDMDILREKDWVEEEILDEIIAQVGMDSRVRYDFERLWEVTKIMALSISASNFRLIWKHILQSLDYIGFSDPSRSGMLGKKEQRSVYIGYDKREDLDILPIQKWREDPRRRVERQVERYRRRMRGARNRVAKRKDKSKRIF